MAKSEHERQQVVQNQVIGGRWWQDANQTQRKVVKAYAWHNWRELENNKNWFCNKSFLDKIAGKKPVLSYPKPSSDETKIAALEVRVIKLENWAQQFVRYLNERSAKQAD